MKKTIFFWCAWLQMREWSARWRPLPSPDLIPRIVHQMYREHKLPPAWRYAPWAWQATHPDYTYRLWDDDELRELIAEEYAWLLPTYDAYPYDTQRWDAARYAILHKFGGLYADLDVAPAGRVDTLLRGHSLLLPHTPNLGLTNALMAGVPGHPFWEQALRALPHYARAWYHVGKHATVLTSTGPTFLWSMYMQNGKGITLVPASVWGKCSVCQSGCASSFFAHGSGSSWHSMDSKIILYVFCALPQLFVCVCTVGTFARTKSLRCVLAALLGASALAWLREVLDVSAAEFVLRPLVRML
jgi:mannosyltransferase OCH1-like enzyme